MFFAKNYRMAVFIILVSGSIGCTYSKELPAKPEVSAISEGEKTTDAGAPEQASAEEIFEYVASADPNGGGEKPVWYVTDVIGMDEGSPNVEYIDYDCSSPQTVKPGTCTDAHFGVIDQMTISDFQTAQVITGFTCGKAPTSDACGGPYTPDPFVMANSIQNKIIASPRGLDVKRSNANQGLLDIQTVGPDTAHREGYERVACAEGYDFVGIRQGRPDEGTYYYGVICRLKMN